MENNHDDQAAMLAAFRHAANSIGVEAGITQSHVDHDEAAQSVCGDHLYIEMVSEAEERFKRLSVKYEQLRVAAVLVLEEFDSVGYSDGWDELKEALSNG
jgi:hypothetical protein